ncbi:hypothetical protein M7I_5964 [Glarea lozoyensis 74030]|uniref:Uncharacterized protein n=1 Tax=Glarea lozoyensis (strain ATCC 74030 / MF5533) TaxID=1104152 RepID=H0ETA5_GLAL7|nr:hypothetical protein M7I_5964 [Glarea lozoyensis 74030]
MLPNVEPFFSIWISKTECDAILGMSNHSPIPPIPTVWSTV